MAQEIEKLSSVKVAALTKSKESGMHNDGGGLYLRIDPRHGGASWIFRYRDRSTGKLRDKGLGPYPNRGLKDARTEAKKLRTQLEQGSDPIKTARATREASKAKSQPPTFGDCANAYVDAHKAVWRSEKHADQWLSTLNTYASKIMKKPVSDVSRADVLSCLEPDWREKTETMTRVRQRIETVIDNAKARDMFAGENPALWRGNLKELLPPPGKLRKVKHHPALQYIDMAAFMAELVHKGAFKAKGGLSYKSLALSILTASRISEVVNADWQEFDLAAKLWRVPRERMKADREHTVPLSDKALELLTMLKPQTNGFLFPNGTASNGETKPITDAAPLKVCKELKRADSTDTFKDQKGNAITVHGFRSTFRDWAADMTHHPREVAEAALAHTLSDKTEAAYRRSDLLAKRAHLMAEWAAYCFAPIAGGGSVTQINVARSKAK